MYLQKVMIKKSFISIMKVMDENSPEPDPLVRGTDPYLTARQLRYGSDPWLWYSEHQICSDSSGVWICYTVQHRIGTKLTEYSTQYFRYFNFRRLTFQAATEALSQANRAGISMLQIITDSRFLVDSATQVSKPVIISPRDTDPGSGAFLTLQTSRTIFLRSQYR